MSKKHFNRLTACTFATALALSAMPTAYAVDGDETATGKVVYSFDFEDGDVSAFTNRGDNDTTELSTTEESSVSGKKSLLASKRSKSWNGPAFQLDDKLEPFTEYYISAKVKGKYYTGATFSFQYTTADGETKYQNLANLNGNDWQTLEPVKVSFTDEMTGVFVYFEGGTDDILIDDFVVTQAPTVEIEQDIPSLSAVFANDFKIGNAITPNDLSSKSTMELIEKHFSGSLTAGNEMKPDAVLNKSACQAYFEETGDDTVPQVSFGSAKPFLNYCQEKKIPVRIHTLVWHSQTPDWFFKEGYKDDGEWVSKEKMLVRMENYIKAYFEELTALYPDIDFYACDVVNEAWLDDGKPRNPGEQGQSGSNNSAWVQVFGDNSFIEPAFEFARKYAPEGCKLYYNDFNEYMPQKTTAIVEMATALKEKGLIDGIGMQSHLDIGFPSVSVYNKALDAFAATGLDIQITELDATVQPNTGDQYFEQQAEYYKGIMDSIYAHKDSISAVVIWGVTDDASWRATKNPLLFDGNYQAKPAFYSIIEGREIPEPVQTTTAEKPVETTTGEKPAETTVTTAEPVVKPTQSGEKPEMTLLGDANEDGKVNVADAAAIIQHIGNQDDFGLSPLGIANAELCDGVEGIMGNDAIAIQKLVAGMITELPDVSE